MISSGGRISFGASSPGWVRRGPGRGSWQLSARAGAGSRPSSAPAWFRRSGTAPSDAGRIRSSSRCSPESTPSTSWRPRCFGSRCIRCHGSASGSTQDLGTARGRRSRGPRRGGGRDCCRPVRRGLHAHDRPARAGTLPGVASLAAADPESRLRVIVTVRADFYDRPLVYPRFGELLSEGPRRSLRSPPRSLSGRSEGRPRGSAFGPSPGS